MPTGTVKDDGDPGNMNGQRIGLIKPDEPPKNLLPFDNIGDQPIEKGKKVDYVEDTLNDWKIAKKVKEI